MAIDSTFWKTELNPAADSIESQLCFSRFSERRANILVREVMLALFSVRVLVERHKMSQEFLASRIQVKSHHKKISEPVTWLNNHKIEELYDMSRSTTKELKPLFLCNQVIHSYIIHPVQDNNTFSDILVCSDYERNKSLHLVPLEEIVVLIRTAAGDFPSRLDMNFNPKRGDYDIKQYK